MIGIINYNAGNIRSVELALLKLNIPYLISNKPQDLAKVDKIIFPGVGEARFAMTELKKSGFDVFLKDWTQAQKPLLGVCLGSQIIFDYSEEGDTPCLSLIPGTVRHFPKDFYEQGLKVPHMGWNNLKFTQTKTQLYQNIAQDSNVYFVHSYYIEPKDPLVITATVDYGIAVPASVKYNRIEAVQFHPEKSGQIGLSLLLNYAQKEN